jgi:hypothetical protein
MTNIHWLVNMKFEINWYVTINLVKRGSGDVNNGKF